ncbi:MAG: AlkA N-terminal domain-containing protein, partial [Gordonia sp. (in: high G+C Gram-positive bacteria)]
LGYTPRHLTRVLTAELGAGPVALARAHRATTARTLLVRTQMPIGDVAFAAGFSSIRQFNDTLRGMYALTPTELRARHSSRRDTVDDDARLGTVTLRLPLRPPYDVAWTVFGLRSHAVAGLETVVDDQLQRTLALPHAPALATLTLHDDHAVARFAHLDLRDLPVAVNRLRRLTDLDADPRAVDYVLSNDPRLAPLVAEAPGIRIPGSVDPAETLIRAMLGQQVSVAAARRRLSDLVGALGEQVPWAPGPGEPDRLFPTAAAIAEHGAGVLTGPARHIRAVVGAAEELAAGRMEPNPGSDASQLRADLPALDGIGEWTADQVVMRVTGDPDVLPRRDLIIDRAAASLGVEQHQTEAWRPWRSYAAMHLLRRALQERRQYNHYPEDQS